MAAVLLAFHVPVLFSLIILLYIVPMCVWGHCLALEQRWAQWDEFLTRWRVTEAFIDIRAGSKFHGFDAYFQHCL